MTVENEIQDLERQLQLKKAYLSVNISFGKGYKAFPDDIREEVESTLKECAKKLAAGSESAPSGLTSEEVQILKGFAQHLLAKQSDQKPAQKSEQESEPENTKGKVKVEKAEQPDYAKDPNRQPEQLVGSKATLLMLDSIPAEQRKLVQPNSEVVILSNRRDKFFVEDPKSNRFWVPAEDLEFAN